MFSENECLHDMVWMLSRMTNYPMDLICLFRFLHSFDLLLKLQIRYHIEVLDLNFILSESHPISITLENSFVHTDTDSP